MARSGSSATYSCHPLHSSRIWRSQQNPYGLVFLDSGVLETVRVTEILTHRVVGGHTVEDWIEGDQLGLWQQLGAIPSIGEDGE